MDHTLAPDWVKSIGEQQEQPMDRHKLSRLRADAERRAIDSDGPRFWRQLEEEIALAIEGCKSIRGI